MNRARRKLLISLITVFILSACSGQATYTPLPSIPSQGLRPGSTQTSSPELTPSLPEISEPALTEPTARLPLTEADVPRVTIQDAKAALDRGEAIIVDVRGADAYKMSHVAGAIHVELGEFETNPTALPLNKDQWIITYCT